MSVRVAGHADVPDLVEMGMRFIARAGTPATEVTNATQFFAGLIDNPAGVIFRTDGGFLAAFVAPLYYRPDYLQAHEALWWSEDGRGLRLLRAYEAWAREMGAHEILMSSLHGITGDPVGKLMRRNGYVPRDITYVKEIA